MGEANYINYGLLFLLDSRKSFFKSSVETPLLMGVRKSTWLSNLNMHGLNFPSDVIRMFSRLTYPSPEALRWKIITPDGSTTSNI